MVANSTHARLAEGLARQGRFVPALSAVEQALRIDDRDPCVHAVRSYMLLAEGLCSGALDSAQRALDVDPACAPAQFMLASALEREGHRMPRAIAAWRRLAELEPVGAVVQVHLGEALAAAGLAGEAIEVWRRALETEPSDPRALYDLALAALRRDGLSTALPGLRRAAELDAGEDRFFFSVMGCRVPEEAPPRPGPELTDRPSSLERACGLAAHGELFGAAETARVMLSAEPDDADALALVAHVFLKQGGTAEALACALRAFELAPNEAAPIYMLGSACARVPGLGGHAERMYAALARTVPDEPVPRVLHAESLVALGGYRAARTEYEQALACDPRCVRALYGLAAVALVEGCHAEAAWHVKRAAVSDTRRRGVFWQLYDSYRAREVER